MRNPDSHHRRLLPCLALCLTMLSAGCTLLSSSEFPFAGKKPEFESPRQVVPVWSDTVLHQSGVAATRGFGGRLMFYGQDKNKPIKVEGSLVVYAWDDSKGSMERTPDRKYVFPAETLQNHYSESTLGHSYSFWVPWDAAGGPLQHATLISRFLSNDGTELTGAPAHVVLEGPSDSSPFPNEISDAGSARKKSSDDIEQSALLQKKAGRIQQAGYTTEEDASRPSNHRSYSRPSHPGLQTSEIGLTSGFYERNMQGSQLDQPLTDFTAVDVDALLEPTQVNQSRATVPREKNKASSNSTSAPADDAGTVEESNQPSTRFPPFESRVQASRATRSSAGHVRKEPLRARWLNGLPETPRSSTNETE